MNIKGYIVSNNTDSEVEISEHDFNIACDFINNIKHQFSQLPMKSRKVIDAVHEAIADDNYSFMTKEYYDETNRAIAEDDDCSDVIWRRSENESDKLRIVWNTL